MRRGYVDLVEGQIFYREVGDGPPPCAMSCGTEWGVGFGLHPRAL